MGFGWLNKLLLLLTCCLTVCVAERIPDCASIEELQEKILQKSLNETSSSVASEEEEEETEEGDVDDDLSLDLLQLCFCEIEPEGVQINCLYGSQNADLKRAVTAVSAANETLFRLVLERLEYESNGDADAEADTMPARFLGMTHLRIFMCIRKQ